MENGTEFVKKARLEQMLWPLEGQKSTGPPLGVTLQGGWFLSLKKRVRVMIQITQIATYDRENEEINPSSKGVREIHYHEVE